MAARIVIALRRGRWWRLRVRRRWRRRGVGVRRRRARRRRRTFKRRSGRVGARRFRAMARLRCRRRRDARRRRRRRSGHNARTWRRARRRGTSGACLGQSSGERAGLIRLRAAGRHLRQGEVRSGVGVRAGHRCGRWCDFSGCVDRRRRAARLTLLHDVILLLILALQRAGATAVARSESCRNRQISDRFVHRLR